MLFDEARREIASLLKTGKDEFDRGNQLVALSLLLEAKSVFNEMLQSQLEKAHGSAAAQADWPSNIGSKLLHWICAAGSSLIAAPGSQQPEHPDRDRRNADAGD
jgi:hypothetical protein